MKCPICNGSGLLPDPGKLNIFNKSDMSKLRQRAAFLLNEEGYTFRQIMKMLGYKSTRSVSELLRQYKEASYEKR